MGTSLSRATDDENAVQGSGEDWLRDGNSRAIAAKEAIEFKDGDGPSWLTREKGMSLEVISSNSTVAQIDPKRLCQWLLERSMEQGVQLHHPATPISVSKDTREELAAIHIVKADGTEADIPCTRLILAAGAWTPQVFSTLFPNASIKIPISPLAGHSILLKSPRWTKEQENSGCHAVFATDTLGFSPELFSRIGEELYIAGLNSTQISLPDRATDVKSDPEAIEVLKRAAARMMGNPSGVDDLELLREGLVRC
jgi:glycine/D-amino acid oxidase-like deaminating enzyme